jgi:hypothetical protein
VSRTIRDGRYYIGQGCWAVWLNTVAKNQRALGKRRKKHIDQPTKKQEPSNGCCSLMFTPKPPNHHQIDRMKNDKFKILQTIQLFPPHCSISIVLSLRNNAFHSPHFLQRILQRHSKDSSLCRQNTSMTCCITRRFVPLQNTTTHSILQRPMRSAIKAVGRLRTFLRVFMSRLLSKLFRVRVGVAQDLTKSIHLHRLMLNVTPFSYWSLRTTTQGRHFS